MTTGGIQCNSCKKTVWSEEEANGWFQLVTLLTQQPFIHVENPRDMLDPDKRAEFEAELRSQLPPGLGGEFCSVKCLTQYVNANDFLEKLSEVKHEGEEPQQPEGREEPAQGSTPPPVRPAVGQDSPEQAEPSDSTEPEVQGPQRPAPPDRGLREGGLGTSQASWCTGCGWINGVHAPGCPYTQ